MEKDRMQAAVVWSTPRVVPVHAGVLRPVMTAVVAAILAVSASGVATAGVGKVAADGKAPPAQQAEHDGHGDHGEHVEIGARAPAGMSQKAFESPVEFRTDLAIWSLAVFALLLGLLGKFAWKPIMTGLEKREEGIERQISETKQANAEAKQMLATYERRLAEASEEVRAMLEEARRDADSTKQTIVAEARKIGRAHV